MKSLLNCNKEKNFQIQSIRALNSKKFTSIVVSKKPEVNATEIICFK